MSKFIKKISKKTRLTPPGTLVHVGEQKAEKAKITIIDYDETRFQEKKAASVKECAPFKDKPTITWINVDGIHEVNIIEEIGKQYGLHPLIMEDILNTGQRPKMEDSESFIFIVLKMLYCDENDN